jgi:hypothetical protein
MFWKWRFLIVDGLPDSGRETEMQVASCEIVFGIRSKGMRRLGMVHETCGGHYYECLGARRGALS